MVAAFDEPKALQSEVSDLQSGGFNRADITFMARESLTGHLAQDYGATRQAEDDPHARREAVTDETDIRQRRTLEIQSRGDARRVRRRGFHHCDRRHHVAGHLALPPRLPRRAGPLGDKRHRRGAFITETLKAHQRSARASAGAIERRGEP
ncbi:MAG TPA: hypothetical protein VGU20_08660 [Stellaceae bacterium]|nr:hypothetical protein [Stellaceae bacterium]